MSLNLGNLTKNVFDDVSFEDEYIEYLELYHSTENLLNAIDIAESAKATMSIECIRFAEELLGCSCEKMASQFDDSGKITKDIAAELSLAKRLAEKLQNKYSAFNKFGSDYADNNFKIEVPEIIVKFANNNMGLREIKGIDDLQVYPNEKIVSYDIAIKVVRRALVAVSGVVDNLLSKKSTIRYAAKNLHDVEVREQTNLVQYYRKVRSVIKQVLRACVGFESKLNRKLKEHHKENVRESTKSAAEVRRQTKFNQRVIDI